MFDSAVFAHHVGMTEHFKHQHKARHRGNEGTRRLVQDWNLKQKIKAGEKFMRDLKARRAQGKPEKAV